jgi:hypothetical protein
MYAYVSVTRYIHAVCRCDLTTCYCATVSLHTADQYDSYGILACDAYMHAKESCQPLEQPLTVTAARFGFEPVTCAILNN